MSSAILYGAIVVIWAGVLIPRWLRRETPVVTEEVAPQTAPVASSSSSSPRPAPVVPHAAPLEQALPPVTAAASAPEPGPADLAEDGPAEPGRNQRDGERVRILRARRRLLGMLLALAVASGALAWMRLAAWWVVLPPTVMLLGYVGLLREASKADAERRSVAAEREAARQQRPEVARPAPAPAPVPVAEVIDITARVSDDSVEQHTEARRAVGAN